MRQQTLAAQTGFEKYGRKTKRERFLEEMEQIVPWAELQALVEPHYPKGKNGRPPVGLSLMLRVYFVQQWFNLSDPGAEDALYESPVLRHFVGSAATAMASAPKLICILSGELQRAAFCRRRCSLAFSISLRSPAGRIS